MRVIEKEKEICIMKISQEMKNLIKEALIAFIPGGALGLLILVIAELIAWWVKG